MKARKLIVIVVGFIPGIGLLFSYLAIGLHLAPSLPGRLLCIAALWLVPWKGKYAPSISLAELALALSIAAFSVLLNMLIPPGGRTPWVCLLAVSLVLFALLGTSIPALWALNDAAWKNRARAK